MGMLLWFVVRVISFFMYMFPDMSNSLDSLAFSNLDFFSEYCFGEPFGNTWFHRRWFDTVQDEGVRRAVSIAPRNSAKTTCWGKKAPLWLLGRDNNLKILLLSRAAERAESNLRFIKQNIESNPKIKRVFPSLEPWEPWSNDKISVVNTRNDGELSVVAKGLGRSCRPACRSATPRLLEPTRSDRWRPPNRSSSTRSVSRLGGAVSLR